MLRLFCCVKCEKAYLNSRCVWIRQNSTQRELSREICEGPLPHLQCEASKQGEALSKFEVV